MANLFNKDFDGKFRKICFAGFLFLVLSVCAAYYYLSSDYTLIGYAPTQSIAFNHKLHIEKAELDCLHCHTTAFKSSKAGIPTTQTCYACHQTVLADSEAVKPIIESYNNKTPLTWKRVVIAPDNVTFSHDNHMLKGVSCQECHGDVKSMELMARENYNGMDFCVKCHEAPMGRLVKKGFETKGLPYDYDRGSDYTPPQNCSGCHK